MKRLSFLMIVSLAFVLSGCVLEFVDVPSAFEITDARFSTNHVLDLGVNGETGAENQPEFVICNDLPTQLIYTFSYTGLLSQFRSYLRGEDTGSVPADGDKTFSTSGLGNPITVTISIPAGLAPRLMAPGALEANAIGVQGIIGYSTLHLDFLGTEEDKVSRKIAIIDNCP
jgi:hypothetical protein